QRCALGAADKAATTNVTIHIAATGERHAGKGERKTRRQRDVHAQDAVIGRRPLPNYRVGCSVPGEGRGCVYLEVTHGVTRRCRLIDASVRTIDSKNVSLGSCGEGDFCSGVRIRELDRATQTTIVCSCATH